MVVVREKVCLKIGLTVWRELLAGKKRVRHVLRACQSWQVNFTFQVFASWGAFTLYERRANRASRCVVKEQLRTLRLAVFGAWRAALFQGRWQQSRWLHVRRTESATHQVEAAGRLQASLLRVCLFARWRARCGESASLRQTAALHAEVQVLASSLRRYKDQMSWQCAKATLAAWRGACAQRQQDDTTAWLQAEVDRMSRELSIAQGSRERRKNSALAIMEGSMNAAFLASAMQTAALPRGAVGPTHRDENSSPNVSGRTQTP